MKLATTRSPKFRRLMSSAGIDRCHAAGALELLWLFTMEQAPAGDVGRWSDADIEAELDWRGEAGALVAALVAAGWVDPCAANRLVVHDWPEHAPEFIQKRVERGKLAFAVVTPTAAAVETCPDTSGQRPPLAGNVGVREEKRREEKPGESTAAAAPPPTLHRVSGKVRKKPETPVPEKLSNEDRDRVLKWAAEQTPPLSQHALTYGWKIFFAKASAKQYRYHDHARGFMNAIGAAGEAWALKGYEPPQKPGTGPGGPGGGGGARRSADDVLAEAKAKQLADDEKAREKPKGDDPETVAKLIDAALPRMRLVRPLPESEVGTA